MIRPAHLIAPAFALLIGNGSFAHAETQVGAWKVGTYSGTLPTRCLMRTGSEQKGHLIGYIDASGLFQLGYQSKRLAAAKDGATLPMLLFDGRVAPVFRVMDMATDIVLFAGEGAAEEEDSIGPLVGTSRVVRIRGRGVDVSFPLDGAALSLEVLRECDNASRPQVALNDEEVEDAQQADHAEPDSEPPSSAGNLSTAMRGITGGQPLIAQIQCSITGRDLTGLFDPLGRDRAKMVTIGVSEDGSGFINGSMMTSAQVERGDGGELIGTAFSFQDVNRAISGGASPLPQMGTLTAEQNAALQALPGLMNGMLGTVMGDRKRFMVVSLQQNNVVFFDLMPAGDTATLTAPDCIRTQ